MKSLSDEMPVTEDPGHQILENANALFELGLLGQALAEYRKLLPMAPLASQVVPRMVECLLSEHSPHQTMRRMEEMLNREGVDLGAAKEIRLGLVQEMLRRGYRDLAAELHRRLSATHPDDKELKGKLDPLLAQFNVGSRYGHLLYHNYVTSDQLQKALELARKGRKSVEFVLMDLFKITRDSIGKSLSGYYGVPFKGFDPNLPVPVELIRNLKKSFLLNDLWVPLSWGKAGVEILIDDPRDLVKTGQIRGLIKTKKINLAVGIREDIEQYIHHFFGKTAAEPALEIADELDLVSDISFEEDETDVEDQHDMLDESSSQIVRLVDQCIVNAYRKDASDVHIEPSPVTKKTMIRFRLDGVCQEYMQVPNSMARGLLSRIKIMAGLDIAERRLPQDGKIRFRRKGIAPIELRVATIPITDGYEDAVLRILAKAGVMKLEQMGLDERNLRVINRMIAKPYGLILVAGPTGSGKTTTLHTALARINHPGIKIWTAEDPVEISQAGLRQVEVNPKIGLTFARVMRSFLRADPDVIMIGEMRDHETAAIGIEASLTGHLVFSTLHTNNASETVTRLLDMGLNPLNFSDAFIGVVAQRLVRKLCQNCRKAYHPSAEEFDEIAGEYGREYFPLTGMSYGPDMTLYRPAGCDECSGTGYKGRSGIYEIMEGTATIKRLIKKQGATEDLLEQALRQGMTTLKQDGIMKVFQGVTDISELRRVCID